MANEASIINNPTSTPAAVSTGYQRQNTRFISQANGVDHTVVDGGAGGVTVRISGPVDVNGVLYSITSAASLNIAAAGRYVVSLEGTGDLLTPTLQTALGTFDDSKNARYTAGGKRILNWLIYYDGVTAYAVKWLTPVSEHNDILDLDTQVETWITSNGSWTAPRSKFYTIYVTGDGQDGGAGGNGGRVSGAGMTINPTVGMFGGKAGSTGIKRIWIDAGDVWTAVFGASANTFSDGVTTLSAGDNSGAVTGCDVSLRGGGGGYGGHGASGGTATGERPPGDAGATGNGSIYGGGGYSGQGGAYAHGGVPGGAASAYGGGGGGGGGAGSSDTAALETGGSGGAGASGAIRIIG